MFNTLFCKMNLGKNKLLVWGQMVDRIIDIVEKRGYEIDFSMYAVNITRLRDSNVYGMLGE